MVSRGPVQPAVEEQFRADPNQRQQIGNRAGNPHDEPGQLLVSDRRDRPNAPHFQVIGIQHMIGENEDGRQHRALHAGKDQIGQHHPARTVDARRIRQHDRIPEQQRGVEKAGVLQIVYPLIIQRLVVHPGHMPKPQRCDEYDPGGERVRELFKASPYARSATPSTQAAPPSTGHRREQHDHRSARPHQHRRHEH